MQPGLQKVKTGCPEVNGARMPLVCVFDLGDALAENLGAFTVAVTVGFDHFQRYLVASDLSSENAAQARFLLVTDLVSGHRHGGADGSDLLIFGAVVGSHSLYSSRAGSDGVCCSSSCMGDSNFSLFDLTGEL